MSKKKEPQRADSIDNEKKNEVRPQKKTTKKELIESFLNMKYEFRFNTIKGKPEVINLAKNEKEFIPINKYAINSFKRELDANGIDTSTNSLKELLESDYSPAINPIQEYFKFLKPHANETDYIEELAGTVTVTNPKKWKEYFTKWLVAVVANAITDSKCLNHTCLVLTGDQGKYKTTWLDNLCPKKLKQYIFTGKIDPTNKDSLTYIAEFLFINIDDQLKQLNKKDENELKNLITAPNVKYRRPYAPYIDEYPHLASFMASVNGNDFLTDPTGSRRFLPFEVTNINISKAQTIDMDKVYSQALHLLNSGFKYWFNDEEVTELHDHNKLFNVISMEEQLIIEFYEIPRNRKEATHFLQSALIQTEIEYFTKQKLHPKKIGEALTKLGFEKWQQRINGQPKWVWSVIKNDFNKREEQTMSNYNQKLEVHKSISTPKQKQFNY